MSYDAIVVGGSFAGLSSALVLARSRRKVAVIDAGQPRNRYAEHSHGFFSRDGASPFELLAVSREQVAAYPTVTFIEDLAVCAEKEGERFVVKLASGADLRAARMILAFGLADELPEIPGLAERWGTSVIQCPYCHGYEFSDQQLGVLYSSEMSVHQAMLVAEWGPTTLLLNGNADPGASELRALAERNITVERARVQEFIGAGRDLSGAALADGRTVALNALYVVPTTHLNSDIAQQLGCEVIQSPAGPMVRSDEMRQTTIAGVFAAGDIVRGAPNVTWAVSDGVMAGTAAHRSLVFPEMVKAS